MSAHPLRRDPPCLAVEVLSIDQLRPAPDNPRRHSRQQIRKIARSIETFGFGVPVLVDGENGVLAGHGRIEACRTIGMAEVPVIRLAHLTPAQAKAFRIAENKLTELGGWDERILGETLRDLSLMDLDFDLEITGLEVGEIDLLIEGLDEASTPDDSDEAPAPPGPAITRPGDLWRIGPHRVLCGDALERQSYERLMGGDRAAAVFADPPYNVAARHIGGRGRIKHRDFAMAAGEMGDAEFTAFLTTACRLAAEWSNDGAIGFWCMDWRHIQPLLVAGGQAYGELKTICVWAKAQAGQGALYRSQHELVAVFKTGRAAHRNNVQLGRFGRNRSNL